MRSITVFSMLMICSLYGSAQLINNLPTDQSGRLSFSEQVDISGTKEELHTQAKMFFASAFHSANDVIQVDDVATGTLSGRGFTQIYVKHKNMTITPRMWYTVTIQSGSDGMKYKITGIYFESDGIIITAEEMFSLAAFDSRPVRVKDLIRSYESEVLRVTDDLSRAITTHY